MWVINESSEVLSFVDFGVLRKKTFSGNNFVSDWVLFTNSLGSCICVRLRKDVLTYQTLDMTSIAWNLLISDHMVWSALPVLGKSAIVTIDNFVLVDPWNEFAAV